MNYLVRERDYVPSKMFFESKVNTVLMSWEPETLQGEGELSHFPSDWWGAVRQMSLHLPGALI